MQFETKGFSNRRQRSRLRHFSTKPLPTFKQFSQRSIPTISRRKKLIANRQGLQSLLQLEFTITQDKIQTEVPMDLNQVSMDLSIALVTLNRTTTALKLTNILILLNNDNMLSHHFHLNRFISALLQLI